MKINHALPKAIVVASILVMGAIGISKAHAMPDGWCVVQPCVKGKACQIKPCPPPVVVKQFKSVFPFTKGRK